MIARMLRVVWLGVVLTALLCGCKNKESKQAAAEPAAAAAAAEPRADTPRARPQLRPNAEHRPRRRIETIETEEMTERFAVPDGVVVLNAPSRPKVGQRVQATYCFENTDVVGAAKKLEASLESKGWSPVHVRVRESQPDRGAVASQQAPYRLSASLRRAPAPECNGESGHTYVTVTMHKVTPSPPTGKTEEP
jgi:hypothetical protein